MAEAVTISPEQAAEYKKLREESKKLTGAFIDTTKVFLNGTPTIKNTFALFPKLPGIIGTFGGMIEKVGGAMEDNVGMWQKLSRAGAGFQGDLFAMQSTAARSRLSLEQYSNLVSKSGTFLANMGKGVADGTTEFTKFQDAMYASRVETDRQSKNFGKTVPAIATQLRNIGASFEEIADVQMYMAEQNAIAGVNQKMSAQQLAQSTAAVVYEQDLLAKLTGISRKEQQEQIQKQRTNAQFQVYLQGLDAKSRDAVIRMVNQAENMGVKNAKEFVIYGNAVSKEGGKQAIAMQGMTDRLKNLGHAVKRAKETQTEVDEDAVSSAKLMSAAVKDRIKMEEMVRLGLVSQNGVVQNVVGMYEKTAYLQGAQAEAQKRATEQNISLDEAAAQVIAERADEIKKAQEDQKKDLPGATDATLRAQEALQNLSIIAKDKLGVEMEGLSTQFKNLANDMAVADFKKFDGALGGLVDAVKKATGMDPTAKSGRDAARTMAAGMGDEERSAKLQDALSRAEGNLSRAATSQDKAKAESDIARVIKEIYDANEAQKNANPRYSGSPGANKWSQDLLSSVAENFGKGTPATLHGNEVVLNQEQIKRVDSAITTMRDRMQAGSKLGSGISPELTNALSTMRDQMQIVTNSSNERQGSLNTMRPSSMADAMMKQAGSITKDAQVDKLAMNAASPEMEKVIKDMMEQMKGPLESIAMNMQQNVNIADKQLRVSKNNMGNLLKGFS